MAFEAIVKPVADALADDEIVLEAGESDGSHFEYLFDAAPLLRNPEAALDEAAGAADDDAAAAAKAEAAAQPNEAQGSAAGAGAAIDLAALDDDE